MAYKDPEQNREKARQWYRANRERILAGRKYLALSDRCPPVEKVLPQAIKMVRADPLVVLEVLSAYRSPTALVKMIDGLRPVLEELREKKMAKRLERRR